MSTTVEWRPDCVNPQVMAFQCPLVCVVAVVAVLEEDTPVKPQVGVLASGDGGTDEGLVTDGEQSGER